MILDKEHLAKVEALAANATPGQWHNRWTGRRHDICSESGLVAEVHDAPNSGNTAEFIAQARDLMPDLCADIRRLAGIIAAQTTALDVAAEAVKGLPGCAVPDCFGCKRNKAIADQIDAARKLGK